MHFNAKSALKTKNPAASDGHIVAGPSGSTPTVAAPLQPFAPHYPFYPNPYGYPTPPPMGYPPPFAPYPPPPPPHDLYNHSRMSPWQQTPSRSHGSRRQRSWDGSSPPARSNSKRRRADPTPPSSPAVEGGSIDDFCDQNPNLPPATRAFLHDLDIHIGQDLSKVKEARWEAAGFALFGWERVLTAYNKYTRSLRA